MPSNASTDSAPDPDPSQAPLFALGSDGAIAEALLEGNPCPVALLTPGGEISQVNRRFTQQFAPRAERLPGSLLVEWLVATGREPFERLLAQLRRGDVEQTELEVNLRASDSHQPRVRLHLRAIRQGGRCGGVCVTVAELPPPAAPPVELDGDEVYQLMFLSNPVPMYIFDAETLQFMDVNEAACRQYGYSREEMLGLTLKQIRPPQEVPGLLRSIDLHRDHHYPATPWLHRHRDGSTFLMEVTTHVIRFAGRRCRLAMAQNVTERLTAQQSVERSEQTLRTIGDNLPGGAVYQVTLDPHGRRRFTHFSAGVERLLGVSRDAVLADAGVLYRLVHPEDAPRLAAAEQVAIDLRTTFEAEFRCYTAGGELRHLRARSAPRRHGDGLAFDGVMFDVTEETRNREALAQSERQYADLLENIQLLAVICDTRGRLTYCNPFFERVTGWRREECLGGDYVERFIPAADRQWVRAALLPSIALGQFPRHQHSSIRTRNGEARTISWNHSAVRDASGNIIAMAAVGEDITEKLRNESIVREREKLLRSLGDNLPGGAIFQYVIPPGGGEGRYTYVSQGIRRLAGVDPADLVEGRLRIRDWVSPAERDRMNQLTVLATQTLQPIDAEVTARLPGGEERIWQWRVATHRLADGSTALDGLILDLTETRRLSGQIQQAQKFQTISVLAGGIAHDFNNLLTAILGFADLASLELPAGDPVHEYLQAIVKSSHRAADLCRQMLAYAGQGRYLVGPIDLTGLVREMARLARTVLSPDAELVMELAEPLPTFEGDTAQIRQVVLNLLTNASEALPPGGGRITLRTGVMHADREFFHATVLSEERPPGEYLYLEVGDTGVGMSEETLKLIFDPFFTTKFRGRGLGLAALLGIMRSHRGAVRVQSEPGRGSTFRVVFPVPQPAADSPVARPLPPRA